MNSEKNIPNLSTHHIEVVLDGKKVCGSYFTLSNPHTHQELMLELADGLKRLGQKIIAKLNEVHDV